MILMKVQDIRNCMCDSKIIKYCNRETLIHETLHVVLCYLNSSLSSDEEFVTAFAKFIDDALNDDKTVKEAVDLFVAITDENISVFAIKIEREVTKNLKKVGYLQ